MQEPAVLGDAQKMKKLSRQYAWQHQYNTVALFRRYGQGRVGDPVPEGFDILEYVEDLLKAEEFTGMYG